MDQLLRPDADEDVQRVPRTREDENGTPVPEVLVIVPRRNVGHEGFLIAKTAPRVVKQRDVY